MIRAMLLGIIPLAAAISLLVSESRFCTVESNDWRRLSVVGRGYFKTVDEAGQSPHWHRTLHLVLGTDNCLCADFQGKVRRIEPTIHVPSDWAAIRISRTGNVSYCGPDEREIQIGSLSLSLFFGDPAESPLHFSEHKNKDSELVCEPGTQGAGLIQQNTEIQRCIPLTFRSILAFVLLLSSVAYCLISVQVSRKNFANSKLQNEGRAG